MLVIHQSRVKLAIVAALFGALTLLMAFMTFVSAFLPQLWTYLGISFFGPVGIACAIAAAASAMSLAKPATLTADDRDLVFRTWRSEQRIAWEDVEDFLVFSPGSRLRSPGVQLKSGARKFVSFGRNWEKSAEEVVEEMRGFQTAERGHK